jgi:hypothetical protein
LSNGHFLFGGTGTGATCAEARTNLTSNMRSTASAYCAAHEPNGMICLFSEETQQPCTEVSPGVFQVPGAAIYTCSAFFCI